MPIDNDRAQLSWCVVGGWGTEGVRNTDKKRKWITGPNIGHFKFVLNMPAMAKNVHPQEMPKLSSQIAFTILAFIRNCNMRPIFM